MNYNKKKLKCIEFNARNSHSISHSYDNRNESYKRNPRLEMQMNSRTEFEARRHDARHGIGHDRDERKAGSGPSYYRGDTSRNTSFPSRDRRVGISQREDWKTSHDSRRSDRYSDKPFSGSSITGFGGNRYSGESRGWNDRSSNSLNKVSYGSDHMSSGQHWSASGDRWNSAISSNDSRSRGQTNLNPSIMSTNSQSIADIFGSNPMPGMNLNMSHSIGGSNANNNIGSNERPYLHNRRF